VQLESDKVDLETIVTACEVTEIALNQQITTLTDEKSTLQTSVSELSAENTGLYSQISAYDV
jgi:hypothetical protein